MFKKMKLATKMAIGFGVLVVISGLLGYVGWSGLTGVATNAELNVKGNDCLKGLDTCASFRKEFAIRGFEKYDENKTAADKWQEAYDTLLAQLQQLEGAEGLSAGDRTIVTDAIGKMSPYRSSFDQQKEARRMKDEAFQRWAKIGWDVTKEVTTVVADVIEPARKAAEQAKNVEDMTRWSAVATKLDESVFQEFLVLRVSAVYLMATNKEEQWTAYQKQLGTVKTNVAAWADLVKADEKLRTVAANIAGFLGNYEEAGKQYYAGIQAQHSADADMATAAKAIVDTITHLQTSLKQQMQTTTARTNIIMIAVAVSGIVMGITLAVLITLSIVRPIKKIIDALTSGSEEVSSAAGQVSAASQSLAEGATEQAAGLEETSSSIEEMSSMTKQNADNAQQANTLAGEAKKAAGTGAESMGRMNAAIQEIQKSSDETSKIIKVIDEIAFQTNLLALNAAVEAARAGEAGKGFAVVAEEVRNLAMRSAEAAKDTSNMIEESVKNSKNGVDLAAEVGKVLEEIVQGIGKTSDLVSEIAAACQEQAQGIDQINTAIAQMDKVTQQNAANAEESASASEELNSQAESMHEIVGELIALAGGASRHKGATQETGQPAKRTKLSHADQAFHKIAKGSNAKGREPQRSAAPVRSKAIPLDEGTEDLNRFNA